eukprot:1111427-Pyramimonas_sp.AAC.2
MATRGAREGGHAGAPGGHLAPGGAGAAAANPPEGAAGVGGGGGGRRVGAHCLEGEVAGVS